MGPDTVRATLNALRDEGIAAGRTRLALGVGPDVTGVATVLAAAALRCRVSLLHPRWTARETERVLEKLDPHVVVRAGSDGSGLEIERRRADDAEGPESPDAGGEWILWSSGTSSGTPRGIVLPSEALVASARAVTLRLELDSEDRWLCTLSPAHVGGLALILRAEAMGSALHAPGPFDPARVARAIAEHAITHLSLVPTQLRRLIEIRGGAPAPGSLRVVLLGGAPTPPALLERAIALGYPVALTWGMTEAASQVATAPPQLVREMPGCVGAPLPGIEVRVSGADGEAGELLVRGPTLASGRFIDPAHPPEPLTDGEGWYATGDLGRFDPDGHLWITGRMSDLIITGGVNVQPAEIEEALRRHPAVHEVAVIGVPDDDWGERVVAVIVIEREAEPPSLEELRSFLEPSLASPKRPRELRIVSGIPRNANGKVDRRVLRRPSSPGA